MHVELFLEEPSSEAFLQGMLGQILPAGTTWNPIVFQGKENLLRNLERRLRGYRKWMPPDWKIVVLIDRDRDHCKTLKARMEEAARAAGFPTKSAPKAGKFVVLNRIAVEELEAWFFGDPLALSQAFPGVPANLHTKTFYRDPDAIAGGTWEALEKVLQKAGYYNGGLAKIEVARKMASHMNPTQNFSASFATFVSGLNSL